jgi:hypothetical protein
MAVTSVRSIISDKAPWVAIDEGILASIANPFYAANRSYLPFKTLRQMFEALDWPAAFLPMGNHPDQSAPGWSEELNGVTTDGSSWFFTSNRNDKPELWKFPEALNLDDAIDRDDLPPGVKWVHLPTSLQAYTHMGDIDYYMGHIYVPLQFEAPRRIAVFDATDLSFVASGPLAADKGVAAWCATNPRNGCLYECAFPENDEPSAPISLSVYAQKIEGSLLSLTYVGEFPLRDHDGLPFKSRAIQGGVFSPNGHLYLVADSRDEGSGVHGFDMISGRRNAFIPIGVSRDLAEGEELEGLTLWNQDTGSAPEIWGQLHVILLDNDYIANDDDLDFKHFRVPAGDISKI